MFSTINDAIIERYTYECSEEPYDLFSCDDDFYTPDFSWADREQPFERERELFEVNINNSIERDGWDVVITRGNTVMYRGEIGEEDEHLTDDYCLSLARILNGK